MHVKYNVEITPAAERDVEEIWIYIADDSPENTTAFITAVLDDRFHLVYCLKSIYYLLRERSS